MKTFIIFVLLSMPMSIVIAARHLNPSDQELQSPQQQFLKKQSYPLQPYPHQPYSQQQQFPIPQQYSPHQPQQPFPQPQQPTLLQPQQQFPQQPQRPQQPFPQQPEQIITQQPQQPFPLQPQQPFPLQPQQRFPQQPEQKISQEPQQPFSLQPQQPFSRPQQPFPQQPGQIIPQQPQQPLPLQPQQPSQYYKLLAELQVKKKSYLQNFHQMKIIRLLLKRISGRYTAFGPLPMLKVISVIIVGFCGSRKIVLAGEVYNNHVCQQFAADKGPRQVLLVQILLGSDGPDVSLVAVDIISESTCITRA
ncbi:gamma-gliadin [Triticum aestivum]|uniref:gamma-gliadin n=1 Tax=Triticum aestivum TaxID=4565 RepID=UPI001D0161DF|nr:gamma-gliadin-like [Triticum aestivum]